MSQRHAADDSLVAAVQDVADLLDGIAFSLGALVAIARFHVMAEGGEDPLEGTTYEEHGKDEGPSSLEGEE